MQYDQRIEGWGIDTDWRAVHQPRDALLGYTDATRLGYLPREAIGVRMRQKSEKQPRAN